MQASLERIFARLESENLYRVATYLDPRYDSKFFISPCITDQVQASFASLCVELKIKTNEDKEPARKNPVQILNTGASLAETMSCFQQTTKWKMHK